MTEEKRITDPKELSGIYKKGGLFDKQRRTLLENFKASETHSNLLLKLKLMVESKVKNNPEILTKNKGKMAALIQGEIMSEHAAKDVNSLLTIVDKDIQDKIIDSPEFHELLKKELRDVKRKQEGISDGEYEKILQEEEKKLRQRELEKQQQKDEERNKRVNKITKAPVFKYNSKSREKDSYRPEEKKDVKKGFHLMY